MIGNRIKLLRQKIGLTQKKLAEMVGVDVSTISKFENGHILPSLKVAVKLANVLGVHVEELFPSYSPHEDNNFSPDICNKLSGVKKEE